VCERYVPGIAIPAVAADAEVSERVIGVPRSVGWPFAALVDFVALATRAGLRSTLSSRRHRGETAGKEQGYTDRRSHLGPASKRQTGHASGSSIHAPSLQRRAAANGGAHIGP